MKKIISICLCVGLIGVLALVWFLERKTYSERIKQDLLEHAFVSSALEMPRCQLMFAEMLSQVESGELPKEEFDRRLNVQLYAGLSQMYLNRDRSKRIVVELETEDGYGYQTSLDNPKAIRRQVGRALSLLNIKSSKELNEALKKHEGFYDMFGRDEIFDEELNIRDSYATFVDHCIESHAEKMEHREFLERVKQTKSEQGTGGNG